jgi:phosphate transport system protein
MQRHIDEELARFKELLLTMASHASAAVTNAMKALLERNDEVAELVEANDTVIDTLEKKADEMGISILALQAPLASDLRLIMVGMKISHDLERVGDEATSIARRAIQLNKEAQLKPYVDLPRMAELGLGMLREALDAFVHRDPAKARQIIPRDKMVDALNKQLYRELVSFVIEDPQRTTRCLHLMFISKSLERIADHATNIAEEVVYLYEARDIRHDKGTPPLETDAPGTLA